ncbi:nSTAND3 domain-containing NTPase [Microbacterium murale]|uniref:Novel STAND NTPase 3 domain-containing protein n=1 Tax=Microbacterium murale TaxID=1081040 RepID=A0ABQ1RNI5_9MICO|nr:hypothetical protein [Microbacterium murale]GGD76550.1 hypothetical protein GCM10007269_19380 [Microbacterium murale]
MAVLSSTFGQTVEPFEDGNDEGRDGAFRGVWRDDLTEQDLAGAFVIQAKHSSADKTLSLSSLSSELPKIADLHHRGLCDNYVLMTNCRVTGESNAAIVTAIKALGVKDVRVWARTWIEDKLSNNSELRRMVPRVYGLGDLTEILDDRRRQQASAILHALGSSTATFVSTAPYRAALDALDHHRAVVLLGGPTVGKSVIAQMLALGAVDAGGMDVIKATSASEFLDAWNPGNPNRMYWVDDVFGELSAEPSLLDTWSRNMAALLAARAQGNRFVFTSRDYVYRDAVQRLKEANVRFWDSARIEVVVSELTSAERQMILYNHMKLGNQSTDFRSRIKPHLEHVSNLKSFTPGLAYRLGNARFTQLLDPSDRIAVTSFFDDPTAYLDEIIGQLNARDKAAVALLFAAGNELHLPIQDSTRARELVVDLGSTLESVPAALESLDGTFVKSETFPIGMSYSFAHPTIREAANRFLQSGVATVASIVRATPFPDLVRQIDLRHPDAIPHKERGRHLIVGEVEGPSVVQAALRHLSGVSGSDEWRVKSDLLELLARRASPDARALFVVDGAEHVSDWATSVVHSRTARRLFGLLQKEQSLPDGARAMALTQLADAARDLRSSVWSTTEWLTEAEVAEIREEVVGTLRDPDDLFWGLSSSYDVESNPDSYLEEHWNTVDELREIFADDDDILARVSYYQTRLEVVTAEVNSMSQYAPWDDDDDDRRDEPGELQPERGTRSIFDDVDE